MTAPCWLNVDVYADCNHIPGAICFGTGWFTTSSAYDSVLLVRASRCGQKAQTALLRLNVPFAYSLENIYAFEEV